MRNGNIVTIMLSTMRVGSTWYASAWSISNILKFPDGMRCVQGDMWVPAVTNFSQDAAFTIGVEGIDVRPTNIVTFTQGVSRLDAHFSFIIA